jgi:hypothetical protein
MKQTAVEWLMEHLTEIKKDCRLSEISLLFNQAKAMEKDQIIYSNYNGQSIGKKLIDIDVNQMKIKAEQYYNETYNNNI